MTEQSFHGRSPEHTKLEKTHPWSDLHGSMANPVIALKLTVLDPLDVTRVATRRGGRNVGGVLAIHRLPARGAAF